ncbi:MAG: GTPase HflX [Lachnospiraceae bacterium]|nr:GTPase HflX [Lachnospiraceae bacterium]
MSELYNMEEVAERLILVGVATSEQDDTKESLEELAELVKTAGAETVAMVIQNREKPHPGTYLGKGKIEEVLLLAEELNADGIVCDDELSPAQMKNLEDAIGRKIMDRTMVILDIFAQHASTREGKIQVELAQLKYRSSRLIGMGNILSRLGGGIGTRGPGEKKLEMDRRLIRDRISQLGRELDDVVKAREVARAARNRNPVPVIAIVGYTNAGKSTLLNYLTNAGVIEEDKLFATLDPTTRNLALPSGQQILLTDTVGFVRKLPHHLIDAFRSTLEEAKYADIILHVVDASNPDCDKHMHVVYETLRGLGVTDKKVITIFNKQDVLREKIASGEMLPETRKDLKADETIKLSAKQGEGMEELLEVLETVLRESKVLLEHVFPYTETSKIQVIRKYGQLLEEEYREDGTYVKAYLPKETYLQLFKE